MGMIFINIEYVQKRIIEKKYIYRMSGTGLFESDIRTQSNGTFRFELLYPLVSFPFINSFLFKVIDLKEC